MEKSRIEMYKETGGCYRLDRGGGASAEEGDVISG